MVGGRADGPGRRLSISVRPATQAGRDADENVHLQRTKQRKDAAVQAEENRADEGGGRFDEFS